MGQLRIEIPQDRVAASCRMHRIRRLSVFGPALREDFRPDSDVDILVSFEEGVRHSLFDLVTMQDELEVILGRAVDLVEREAVEQGENYIRRRHILANEEHVDVAG